MPAIKSTEDQLREIIIEELNLKDGKEARLGLTSHFGDDLGGDSLSLVGLKMKIEGAFGIHISDEDWVSEKGQLKISTLENAISYIEAKKKS